jgi:cation transporter-like permease
MLVVPTICVAVPTLRGYSPELMMISGSLLATSMGYKPEPNPDTIEFKLAIVLIGSAICFLGVLLSLLGRVLLADPRIPLILIAWFLLLASELCSMAGVRSLMRAYPFKI